MTPNQETEKRSGEGRVELVGENALTRAEAMALDDWVMGRRPESGHGLRVGVLLDRAIRKLRTALKESS